MLIVGAPDTTALIDTCGEQLETVLSLVHEARDIPGVFAEVGAWKCGVSIEMAKICPEKHVYAFDIFGGFPYEHTQAFKNFAILDFAEVQERVKPYPNVHLIRGKHEETIPTFTEVMQHGFALIYMDSDFYSSHKVALDCFGPLVNQGGIICFHDWSFGEVKDAVKDSIHPKDWEMSEENRIGILRRK